MLGFWGSMGCPCGAPPAVVPFFGDSKHGLNCIWVRAEMKVADTLWLLML